MQINGREKNDVKYQDSGIEQKGNVAHPNKKKLPGPWNNLKSMLKGNSYQMMIDQLSHTTTELRSNYKISFCKTC